MTFSTIALYASAPGSICSTPHSFQINAHASCDFDFNTRSSSSPPPTTQKPVIGGLSSMFSSNSTRHAASVSTFSGCGEELGSAWHDRGEEWRDFSSSSSYSPTNKCFGSPSIRDQSPVSVFNGPVSCCSSGIDSSMQSRPMWITQEKGGDVSVRSSIQGGSSGLINGFTRNPLQTFVDYDSPSFQLHGDILAVGSSALIDELTFNVEDDIAECDLEPYAKDLLLGAQLRHKIFFDDLVIKAFYEAEKAHKGQMRASGDPYLQHCVETAMLLALVGANSTVVAAGLLHDTLDDSFLCYDDILLSFGAGVADLVEGVSKLSQLSKLARENNTASKTMEADRLHTMLLAIADPKAVLIKLADRLHNMMTLDALPLAKQQRFAKETLEIFAPLSNRLGISSWKEQLENLCFKHLNPGEHKNLSSKLLESSDKAMIASAIGKLEKALKDEGISYNLLSGRHKTVYSIYRKMLKKKLTMNEIHDIHGLRLIVDNEEDCYSALRVVHELWSEVPGKLKDYITHPKFNGYQSIHTIVTDESMVPIEVQIRTKEMHLQAEFGFAAHWRYKEGDCEHSLFVLEMVERARSILTGQCESMSKAQSSFGSFPSRVENFLKPHGQNGPIFVIMLEKDKMSILELPINSSIMDVLERAGRGRVQWMPYGFPVNKDLQPRLNHKPTNPWCKLKMGDIVELTASIPNKSLTVYREEIQRMYDNGVSMVGRS